MDTETYTSKADLLREAERRGMKNVTTMKKVEIARKLGVTLTPRPKLTPDEKQIRSRAYARKHYHKMKRKKTTTRPPRRPSMIAYIHITLMYMIILLLFITNNALVSF